MASPISGITQIDAASANTTQTQSVAKAVTTAPSQTPTKSNLPNDTVQISPAAQTAVQEALETRTQTLLEAAKGDPQAARLLAQEALVQQLQK